MKRLTHLTMCTLLMVMFLSFSAYSSGRAQPLPAQQLRGDAARQFLAREGILARIEAGGEATLLEPPQGRSFLEPQPHTVADADDGDWLGLSISVDGDTLVVGAPRVNIDDAEHTGAAYVFERDAAGVWHEQQKLVASDWADYEYFGQSVALEGDTLVVGAHQADIGGNMDQGAAYIFTRDGSTWSEQQKLVAGDGIEYEFFGASVALQGDTMVVGAPLADIGPTVAQGAVYVFTRSGTNWSEHQKLSAGDGAMGDWFGGSVALDADTIVVGADWARVGGNNSQGAAYVFTRSGTNWSEQQKLVAGDGMASDFFGGAVALDGETILVGASNVFIGASECQGAAYVFTRSGTSWDEEQKLLAGDGAAFDCFGWSVALEGDTAVVGAPGEDTSGNNSVGAAYVFTRAGDGSDYTWTEQQKLFAGDGGEDDSFGMTAIDEDTLVISAHVADSNGMTDSGKFYTMERGPIPWPETSVNGPAEWETAAGFGMSVTLDGQTAIVGAPSADFGENPDQGAAYIFTFDGASWNEGQTLTAGDASAEDSFGRAVALEGGTAIVGADGAGDIIQGAAYVFTFDGAVWEEQQQLTAGDGETADGFGGSLALDGDTLIVGAIRAGDTGQGAAYIFTFDGASWSEQQALTAGDGAFEDYFGTSVALDGDTALIGADGADVGGNGDQGAAYVFSRDGGGVWSEQQKLTAGDGTENDEFGVSVALDGDTAITLANAPDDPDVPNQWAAYAFFRDGGGLWSEEQKFTAGDGGGPFGINVALSGDIAIIGVPVATMGIEIAQGAAYVYRRGEAGWIWEQKLLAGNGAPGAGETYDQLGAAVALDGDRALVGAPGEYYPFPSERARVHFFERLVLIYDVFLPGALKQ